MKKRLAFTLVELIIVILIVGILVAIGLAQYSNVIEKARSAEAYSVLAEIVSAEKRYSVENNSYTDTLTNLDIFESAPTSANFTFSIGSTDPSSGYGQAARICPAGGCGNRMSYGMCLTSGKRGACDADDACNPICS